MNPVVRYMLLCDDARIDPDRPHCTHVDCLMSNLAATSDPPFPLVKDAVCVYLVLTDCYGRGVGQVRVAYVDGPHEEPPFGSADHVLDFTGRSPLEALGVIFRVEGGRFPRPGMYAVQFWYNGAKLDERPLRVR